MIEGGSVVHEVTYPHPPERVWKALVDPDELGAWLMDNDFVPTVGGRFTMDCEPIGPLQGEVLEVDPPRRLSYKWTGAFGVTVVTFQLTPIASGTHVRLEHRGWTEANTAARDQFDGGWTSKLGAGLRNVLANAVPSAQSGGGELE
jgi:uncharacterized protein YndB with AHSA1/START domain